MAFAVFLILLFFQSVQNKLTFVIMVLIATIIPDLDSSRSSYGRHLIFRPFQFFVKHRGFFHSFTTAVILSLILAVFWPKLSFGFFLGFTGHLIIDSFTKDGIRPFWPLKWKSSGSIVSGGRVEEIFYMTMIFVNILVFVVLYVLG